MFVSQLLSILLESSQLDQNLFKAWVLQLTWELDLPQPPQSPQSMSIAKKGMLHPHAAGNPLIWCSSCAAQIKHHQAQARDSTESEGI